MARFAVAEFMHETNTFAPVKTGYEAFLSYSNVTRLIRRQDVLDHVAGANTYLEGFVRSASHRGHEIVPVAYASASPAGAVSDEAFERISGAILSELDLALNDGPLDAVYLALHGAMVTETYDSGEVELLSRVRRLVGPKVRLLASLDLHANVPRDMVELCDLLHACREYPHTDMAETGARLAQGYEALLGNARTLARAYRPLDFLTSAVFQSTLVEPARRLYDALRYHEAEAGLLSLSFTQGFPSADVAHCGQAVFGYGFDAQAVQQAVEGLAAQVTGAEPEFAGRLWTPDEAVRHALADTATKNGPIVMADTQDNPGGGGAGDTTAILSALLEHDARGAVVAVLVDPEAAALAHAAGEGAEIDVSLGGWAGLPDVAPLRCKCRVERLASGDVVGTGAMARNARLYHGPMAVLRVMAGQQGVRIVVGSIPRQVLDRAVFAHVGIDDAASDILVLKSSVHFRADFEPIAREVLVVVAPGAYRADLTAIPFRRLRPGLRIGANGPPFDP
ncbi:Microcystin degradation protein MlrC, contains DUF1485 domain [Rhizobiales bacterium GAS188]|nr:Microcystin degradation protein MlrC, contains DUF1485 domain [Rhizobiales bacterium GAS188]